MGNIYNVGVANSGRGDVFLPKANFFVPGYLLCASPDPQSEIRSKK